VTDRRTDRQTDRILLCITCSAVTKTCQWVSWWLLSILLKIWIKNEGTPRLNSLSWLFELTTEKTACRRYCSLSIQNFGSQCYELFSVCELSLVSILHKLVGTFLTPKTTIYYEKIPDKHTQGTTLDIIKTVGSRFITGERYSGLYDVCSTVSIEWTGINSLKYTTAVHYMRKYHVHIIQDKSMELLYLSDHTQRSAN